MQLESGPGGVMGFVSLRSSIDRNLRKPVTKQQITVQGQVSTELQLETPSADEGSFNGNLGERRRGRYGTLYEIRDGFLWGEDGRRIRPFRP